MYYTSRQVKISLYTLIKDLIPVLSLSLCMFLAIWLVTSKIENSYVQLLAGLTIGAFIYGGGAYLLRMKEINYITILSKKIKLWN